MRLMSMNIFSCVKLISAAFGAAVQSFEMLNANFNEDALKPIFKPPILWILYEVLAYPKLVNAPFMAQNETVSIFRTLC